MSYCREEGKDKIIFVTQADHDEPSTADIDFDDDEDEPGLILPNGDINWSCPCLGGMAVGPCGPEFKEAFSCFHYSSAEMKGSDCMEQFQSMQQCMKEYPELYPDDDDDDLKEGEEDRIRIPNLEGNTEEQTPTQLPNQEATS